MDNEDMYLSKYYLDYFKVYKYDRAAFNMFDDNVDKVLCKLGKLDKSYENMGVVNSNEMGDKTNKIGNYYGLLSIDNLDGTGHWCGFVIQEGVAHVFDSMGPTSKYWEKTEFLINYKFPNVKIERADSTPQPWGGEVPKDDTIMRWAIINNQPLPPYEHHVMLGYKSQHRYCYMEALRYVTTMLQYGKFEEEACDSKASLKRIKGHMTWLGLPAGFFYIYNPFTESRESIYE